MEDTPCTVTAVRDLGPDAIAVELESPPDFEARPGQFVSLTFSVDVDAVGEDARAELDADSGIEHVSRFYTISSPDVEDTFELTIEIDHDGAVGPSLAELGVGDVVPVSGPFGRDYYEDEASVTIVAGGPGVGPAVGIAERAIDDGGVAAVVYRDETPLHEDRLSALEDAGGFVRVLDPDESLDDAVAGAIDAAGADTQLFVYGFADFIDAATTAIQRAGADAGNAKIENFG